MTPYVRRATQADVEVVTACVEAAYKPYLERLGQPPGPLLDDYALLIEKHHVWLLESGSKTVGLLILVEKEGHVLLDNVAVHPDFQGKGWGKRLIAFAEQQTRELGYIEIQLYTHEKMLENQALYQNLGYSIFDRRFERVLKRVYMKKVLASS